MKLVAISAFAGLALGLLLGKVWQERADRAELYEEARKLRVRQLPSEDEYES